MAASSSTSSSAIMNTNNSESSRCCVCYNAYNRTNRAPTSMNCGHTFCHSCVYRLITEKLFLCAICRRVSLLGWSRPKKNLALIEMLEKDNLLASDDTNEMDSIPKGESILAELVATVNLEDMLSHAKFYMKMFSECLKSRQASDYRYSVALQRVQEALSAINLLVTIGPANNAPSRPASDNAMERDREARILSLQLALEGFQYNLLRNRYREVADQNTVPRRETQAPSSRTLSRPSVNAPVIPPPRAGPVLRPRHQIVNYRAPIRRTRRAPLDRTRARR